MLFSSSTFLFVFLPLLFILLIFFNKKFHNIILLLASIIFYAFGEPKYLIIIFGVVLISYIGAILINQFDDTKRKVFLFLTISANLGFLLYFKYFNFLINIFNYVTNMKLSVVEIVLPLGISFYTLQALSYVIDVYKKEVNVQKNIYKFSLYICLFPQLIAGPIIKYHDIEDAINSREITFEDVVFGVKRFIIGLAKKMLIANTLGTVATAVFNQIPTAVPHYIVWLGAIAYSLQIFFDFSGYSDMAIGLGRILGFNFMENFNYPYIAKSITDYWRRWHISLSTWFKYYVYIPLGGNKKGKAITVRNLAIVFFLTGLWHGANWNFILWGLWHGFFVIIEKIINIKEFEVKYTKIWQKTIMHIYCLFVVIVGFVLFNNTDLSKALGFIKNMLGLIQSSKINQVYSIHYYIDAPEVIIFIIAILCCVPIFKNILMPTSNIKKIFLNIWFIFIFLLSVMAIAANTYNPFIYFRF